MGGEGRVDVRGDKMGVDVAGVVVSGRGRIGGKQEEEESMAEEAGKVACVVNKKQCLMKVTCWDV